jgi:serine phosphatase RsbU (regulator of sigma subunit)
VAYFLDVTVLGVLLNRVICGLFFDERRGRIELRRARDALFSEMEVAQKIQMSLVPESPTLPGMQVAGLMLPASEVGGDYYDVITTSAGRRFLAIGDVSGHGVTSGLTMMMARASLVGALEAQPTATLPELYAALNRGLRHNLARMGLKHFMTCALLEHLGGGRFRAVGGHLPAMIYRFASGAVEQIELAGVWLGVLEELPAQLVPETDFELAEGDHMLLYTDGVTELMIGREMFGIDRLRVVFAGVAAGGPEHAIAAVTDALQRFSRQQEDDVTMLAVQRGRERQAEQAS